MKKIFVSACILILAAIKSFSQSANDAIRSVYHINEGSARSLSMGNSGISLGGEMTLTNLNPASAGVNRSSEIQISPNLNFITNNSIYNNTSTTDRLRNFSISNIGVTLNYKNDQYESPFLRFNFGLAHYHLHNFNENRTIAADFNRNSILKPYTENVQGQSTDMFGQIESLLWNTYLIDSISGTLNQYNNKLEFGGVGMQKRTQAYNYFNNTDIFFATSYLDKLYLGMSISLLRYNYRVYDIHEENSSPDSIAVNLNRMAIEQEIVTEGRATSMKLGAIYVLNPFLRMGISYHAPFRLNLTDSWDYRVSANYKDVGEIKDELLNNLFVYKMRLPQRIIFGISGVYPKIGAISVDVEQINYHKTFYPENSAYSFEPENKELRNVLRPSYNINIGGEYLIGQQYALRAGYRILNNPVRNQTNNIKTQIITLGAGVRFSKYFLDVAYAYNHSKFQVSPFNISDSGLANIHQTRNNFTVTFGIKF
jgi:hypothetical protein